MKESAVWTKLEYWGDDGEPYLKEYEGQGLLKDKAVLITGGDSGIGRSVALLMAREGADVSIVYLPEEEEDARWTIQQIEKSGRKGHGMTYNLREEANCKSAVEEHMKVFGKLNVLVNNSKDNYLDSRQDGLLIQPFRFYARSLRRSQGYRHGHRGEDLQDKHHPDDGNDKICSETYEARRQHCQFRLCGVVHG